MPLLHHLLRLLGHYFGKNKLNILFYHQVVSKQDVMRPDEPTAAMFRWQMRLIHKYFTPISITDAVKALEHGNLPDNAICVTFDDGYLNNLTVAQPILSEFNIPATVYIATAFTNEDNMFNDRIIDLIGDTSYSKYDFSSLELGIVNVTDVQSRITLYGQVIAKVKYLHYSAREKAVDLLYLDNRASEYCRRMMNIDEIEQLAGCGVDIGAHTVNHPILRTLTSAVQNEQICESKSALEAIIGRPVVNFAYPNGKLNDDYSEDTVSLVNNAGFTSAVSTHKGVSDAKTDKYQLRRFTPWDKTPLKFHLRLLLAMLKG